LAVHGIIDITARFVSTPIGAN